MILRFKFIGKSAVLHLILITFFSPALSAQNILQPAHDTVSLKHELTRTYQMAYAFLKKNKILTAHGQTLKSPP